MGRYIAVRTVWVFIVLIIILTLNYTLIKIAPEFPPTTEEAKEIYYQRQVNDGYMTERIERNEWVVASMDNQELVIPTNAYYEDETDQSDQYRIYEPISVAIQYFRWVSNIVTKWDWGVSTRIAVNQPAFGVIADRMGVTLKLNLLALVFYIPIGFLFGIIAALNKNSWIDNVISFTVMIFISIPSFVLTTFLLMLLGYSLGWVPTQFPSADLEGAIQITGLIIPILGLSFGSIAGLTRVTRAELTEVLTSEFLLLARTKGLTKRQAVVRHAMRNSMVPLVPGIIGSFVGLLSGSVIIERIYGIPGTGRIYLRALTEGQYDYNVLLVSTAFYTIIGLFAVLLVDLSYGLVDPRIRMGARR